MPSSLDYQIIDYEQWYEAELLALEQASPQGTSIQLQMLRDSYTSRSVVYPDYRIFLAVTPKGELMGVLAAALVEIEHLGQRYRTYSVYDVKVAPAFRGHGLTKLLGQYAVANYAVPTGIERHFLTMKASNEAVYKSMFAVDSGEVAAYPFSYLTIPSHKRLRLAAIEAEEPFRVALFDEAGFVPRDYYHQDSSGLAYFNTYKMYNVKLLRMPAPLRWAQRLLSFVYPAQKRIPRQGQIFRFAALYGHDAQNLAALPALLERLRGEGIDYLNICCSHQGPIYKALKPYSINDYKYIFLSNFNTTPSDALTLDVRCL